MSNVLINHVHRVGSAKTLTDADSVVLSDMDAVYGIRRADTESIIVAAGTALARTTTGTYQYEATGLLAGVEYEYHLLVDYNGSILPFGPYRFTPPSVATGSGYVTVDEANSMAELLLNVGSFTAASSADKAAAILLASDQIDNAMRFQGRRYDEDQAREFPRVSRDIIRTGRFPVQDGVWDWDSDNNEAVVPTPVKHAVIYQAASLLSNARESRLDDMHDGLAAQSVGGMSESYKETHSHQALCRRAYELLQRYQLRTGRLL